MFVIDDGEEVEVSGVQRQCLCMPKGVGLSIRVVGWSGGGEFDR